MYNFLVGAEIRTRIVAKIRLKETDQDNYYCVIPFSFYDPLETVKFCKCVHTLRFMYLSNDVRIPGLNSILSLMYA